MLILGIETSCDETSLALVKAGKNIIADSTESQDDIHGKFGGVVPEFAARHHIERINIILDIILKKSGFKISDIDAIGVTNGPGLTGSLLVGFMFARGLSYSLKKPLICVNHIYAHLYMPFMIFDDIEYPHYSVLLSGGHTFIFKTNGPFEHVMLSRTMDDAIGEAFDKVAFFLGIGYPGGKVIDNISEKGDPNSYIFPTVRMSKNKMNVSYSGLKTHTIYKIKKEPRIKEDLPDFLASFQKAAFGIIMNPLSRVLADEPLDIVFGGGVAANSYLRSSAKELGDKYKTRVFFPPAMYCTDNGAMIGGYAFHLFKSDMVFRGEDVFSRADFRKIHR